MARLLLIVCAILACGLASAQAQTATTTPAPQTTTPAQTMLPAAGVSSDAPAPPPARLIKQRMSHSDAHALDHAQKRPLDDRCRPLKDQLDLALQKPKSQRRLFQARVAGNAGSRFCREGHPDKGIAELQRGLSYLQETAR